MTLSTRLKNGAESREGNGAGGVCFSFEVVSFLRSLHQISLSLSFSRERCAGGLCFYFYTFHDGLLTGGSASLPGLKCMEWCAGSEWRATIANIVMQISVCGFISCCSDWLLSAPATSSLPKMIDSRVRWDGGVTRQPISVRKDGCSAFTSRQDFKF
jgi:hypothetical protein